jgi:hypothetical protein
VVRDVVPNAVVAAEPAVLVAELAVAGVPEPAVVGGAER